MIVGKQNPLPQRRAPGALRAICGGFWLVLGILVTLLASPASAQDRGVLTLTGSADIETTGAHFDYVLDHDRSLSAADLIGPDAVEMQPMPGTVPDFGYTAARIWLRIEVINGTADVSDWRFHLHTNFTQEVAIYRAGADDTIATLLDLDTQTPFSARPVDYPQLVAPFTLEPGERATLLVVYFSQGSSRISMSVETAQSFAAGARVSEAKNYAFYGMMLVLVAMSSVALLVLRQLVFAAYAAYVLSLSLYVVHGDGVAFQYLWPNLPEFNSMASVVAGSCVMVFGALFAMSFLQTRRYHPIMHRILLAVVTAVLVLDVVLWATAPQLLKQLLVVMISVCVLTYISAGLVAARTRFREVRFYLFAWLASLIPATLFTARFAFGLESTLITPYDAVRLALIFDALMMGLAVFDGYNQQRQSALEQTLAHAQRNLALGQRLAVLEERYEQVTALARRREESVKDTVHDLRQPMHALRLSLRQMFNPADQRTTDIGQVESALTYMEQLVAGRLAEDNAAPAGDGGHEGDAQDRLGLHEVLRGVADMFGAEAAAKGLDLKLVLATPDAPVAAYPLMRVAANLVSNAIKYTREGRIVIALRREGRGHRLEIHDTGPGLKGAEFEQALRRNERLDRDRDVAAGSGLGLAVVRETAESNGWRVSSCAARQTGASLRVHLPGEAIAASVRREAIVPAAVAG
jgi:signal transduction histidine kinase